MRLTIGVAAGWVLAWGLGCGTSRDGGEPPRPDGSAAPAVDAAGPDVSTGPAHVVGACDSLGARGAFEAVTPPQIAAMLGRPNALTPTASVMAFAVDPVHSGTVYLGTTAMGVWKTTDCGATWVHVNTGRHGADLDRGMNWTFAIDPNAPNVLYTNSGYGTNIAYRSTNGGVDWDPIWPPADPALANVVEHNFVALINMDPGDSRHLLMTFHAPCAAPYARACFAESEDGGTTWVLRSGHQSWVGDEGNFAWFLGDRRSILWGSQSNGLWRSRDGGASWTQVGPGDAVGHNAGQLHRARDGVYYLAAANGVLRSADGDTWTLVPGTGPLAGGLVSDGTTMFLSTFVWCNFGMGIQPYMTAPESDGRTWRSLASPAMDQGGALGYDRDHHVLYSSNGCAGGFWRVVTE
jgi:hypothetical protein